MSQEVLERAILAVFDKLAKERHVSTESLLAVAVRAGLPPQKARVVIRDALREGFIRSEYGFTDKGYKYHKNLLN